MQEKTQRRREAAAGPGGLDDLFGDAGTPVGLVEVNHGLYTENLPVAGLSVGEIRSRYRDRFDIDPRGGAQIDGRDVDDSTTVRAGQILMFVRHAGEKGMASG
jgi:hypothetical protein